MIIRRILIANRSEIAARIIRSCRELGIETVLAASDADLESVPARQADQVVRLGPSAPARSYLNVGAVIAAAKAVAADAVHPGYGFLSENPVLARACIQAGLVFIGATEEQLKSVGDKWRARQIAIEAGLPVVPGRGLGPDEDIGSVIAEVGLPALVKAVGGGGGRGMKLIRDRQQATAIAALAMAEAEAAFGDARVYVERFIDRGRHVEVQVLGDGHDLIHLGTRDCSVQRRYQKVVEEAPAPGLPETLRSRLHVAATDFARAIAYRGLGTVEFLLDVDTNDFYFLEMNARIQVEHPVTEAITGLDLIAEQIAVAEGRPLRLRQEDIRFDGHAVEFRINAEDASRDFRPSPGRVTRAVFPAGCGIRVDSHIEAGTQVPPFYDSLIAKLVAHGVDRNAALDRSCSALAVTDIRGVATTTQLLRHIAEDARFRQGAVTTNWFDRFRILHSVATS